MKKNICIVLLMIMCTSLFIGCNSKDIKSTDKELGKQEELLKDIEKKLIRFHVIANSDKDEDQNLKLKVRDEVLKYMQPKLNKSQSLEESRKILKEYDSKVKEIAKKVIKENGYDYKVETTLGQENFPEKSYGNITLPQGEYEAYRIIIGSGSGHNWWCVMFPPLCFVDMSKGQVSYDSNEEKMKKVLNEEEFALVDNTKEEEQVEVRFKLWDKIKELFS